MKRLFDYILFKFFNSWTPLLFLIPSTFLLFLIAQKNWLINLWNIYLDIVFGIVGFLLSIIILLKQISEERFIKLPNFLTIRVYHSESLIFKIIKVPLVAEEDIRAYSQSVVSTGFKKSGLLNIPHNKNIHLDIDYMANNNKSFEVITEEKINYVHYSIDMVLFKNPLEDSNIEIGAINPGFSFELGCLTWEK